MATQHKLCLHQMDASVYLHVELSEEVLLLFKQPEEFAEPSKENLDCHEKCNIYRLIQSPRCWNHIYVC